jgi:hypothetical protein
MQNVFHQFEKSQKFHGCVVEISDDDAMLFVYLTIPCLHKQQNQEFRSNREN